MDERPGSLISRRTALQLSGAALVGLSPLAVAAQQTAQQAPAAAAEFPNSLVEQKLRDIVALPLNPDGTAKEFPESSLTPVADIGVLDRNGTKPVQIDL